MARRSAVETHVFKDDASGFTFKAHVVGQDVEPSAAIKDDEDKRISDVFSTVAKLEPPYSPRALERIAENSGTLGPNIDAYVTNIDGMGHALDAVVDFDRKDSFELVREAMIAERLATEDVSGLDDPRADAVVPTDEQVTIHIDVLRRRARLEKMRLESFLRCCSSEGTFTSLRESTRRALETTGNAYWEVLRNKRGEVARFVFVGPKNARCTQQDEAPLAVSERVPIGLLGHEEITQHRFFRRYIQAVGRKAVYFKAFGDPRWMSRKTGKTYRDAASFAKNVDVGEKPATEIIHWKIGTGVDAAYGMPRWIGNLLAVLGCRAADEVNYAYFDNKAVPPLMLLVSGGKLGEAAAEKIENFIRDNLRGRESFHKILVVEAAAAGTAINDAAVPKLALERLGELQATDALFLNYDERCADKVGASFRLPRIVRGDTRDFNRACYSADTEVLTERGWKLHDEIGPGERIAVVDPDTGRTKFDAPLQLHRYWYDGDMVSLVGRGTDVLVTPEHKMLIASQRRGIWRTCEAKDLLDLGKVCVRTSSAGHDGEESRTFELPKVCQIERGHGHESVSVDRFAEFLGYFCSDGGLLETEHPSAPYLVFLRQKKDRVAKRMRACLEELGWTYNTQVKADGAEVYGLSNRCLRAWLAEHCGGRSETRRLPEDVFVRFGPRQLRILFEAAMDGDGTWDRERLSGCYYSKSSALAGQIQAISSLLGYRASLRWSKGAGVWRVMIAPRERTIIRDGAETIPYRGEVFCFATTTGFYVTRRNGKIAYQGNTAQAALKYVDEQVFGPERRKFDDEFNQKIVSSELGVRLWKYRSLGPVTSDLETIAPLVQQLVGAAVLVPNEARDVVSKPLGKELAPIDAAWAKQPLEVTLGGGDPSAPGASPAPATTSDPLRAARDIVQTRTIENAQIRTRAKKIVADLALVAAHEDDEEEAAE